MNFENFQHLWQNPPTEAPTLTDDRAAVLARVRKRARSFDRTIIWRDLREGLAAILVAAVFGGMAWTVGDGRAHAWMGWTAAALPLAVAGFLYVDRWRARQRRPTGGETVVAELERSLAEVRHQAWLLANVTWWYLLPLAASATLFCLFVLLHMPLPLAARLVVGAIMFTVIAATHSFVWWLNRRALQRQLHPLIAELEDQRRALSPE